jgi:hypothetical protein
MEIGHTMGESRISEARSGMRNIGAGLDERGVNIKGGEEEEEEEEEEEGISPDYGLRNLDGKELITRWGNFSAVR